MGNLFSHVFKYDAISLLKTFIGPDGNMLIAASGPLNEPLDTEDSVEIESEAIFPDSFSMITAASKVEKAISNLGTGQPVCSNVITNCKSFDVSDEIKNVYYHCWN